MGKEETQMNVATFVEIWSEGNPRITKDMTADLKSLVYEYLAQQREHDAKVADSLQREHTANAIRLTYLVEL